MKRYRLYALLLSLNLAGFPLVAGLSAAASVSSTPISVLLRSLILVLSGLLILLAVRRRHAAFFTGWFWVPFALFWGAYVLRLLADTVFPMRSLSRPSEDYWIWAIGACLIPTVALLAKEKTDAYPLAYRLSLAMLFTAASLAAVFGDTVLTSQLSGVVYDSGRLQLESLNPISLGHLGVSLLLLTLWRSVSQRENSTRAMRTVTLAGSALGLYLTVAAASRGPIISLIIALLFYILAIDLRRAWKPVALVAMTVAVFYILAARFEEAGQFQTVSRIVSAFAGQDVTVSGREQSIVGAWQQFARSPLIGDALEEETTGFYPHNVVVESFMATGVAGGLSLVALIFSAITAAYRLVKWRSEHAWVALVFVQYLAAAQFSGAIYGVTMMWTLLGATIALSCGFRRNRAATFELARVAEGEAH